LATAFQKLSADAAQALWAAWRQWENTPGLEHQKKWYLRSAFQEKR